MRLARFAGLGQTSPMIRTCLLALLLALGLGGCGFHLREALRVPADLGVVRVTASDPYSALARSLERSLGHAGVEVVAPGTPGRTAVLAIRSERWASLPASIDEFGRAQELTLRYAVVFALTDANGDEVVPQQAVELARDYISVPTDQTGTESEAELLAREMQREMTAAILRRIDAATRGRTQAAQ